MISRLIAFNIACVLKFILLYCVSIIKLFSKLKRYSIHTQLKVKVDCVNNVCIGTAC